MASFSLGGIVANHGSGNLGGVALNSRVPLTKSTHVTALAGVFSRTGAGVNLRDVQLGLPVLVVDDANFRVELRPGVSIPLGLASSGLRYTILATGSVDPMLGGTIATGEAWVLLMDIDNRVSLYAGPDGVVQGMYSQGTARVARRISTGAVFAGLTLGGQTPDAADTDGFAELAPLVGAQIPIARDWGAGLNIRVPVWTTEPHSPYTAAAALSISWVARPKTKKKTNETNPL